MGEKGGEIGGIPMQLTPILIPFHHHCIPGLYTSKIAGAGNPEGKPILSAGQGNKTVSYREEMSVTAPAPQDVGHAPVAHLQWWWWWWWIVQ